MFPFITPNSAKGGYAWINAVNSCVHFLLGSVGCVGHFPDRIDISCVV
jgi:hypothetical protein